MGKVKAQWQEEYEQAFPYEQEYNMWMAGLERDFQEELQYRAGLVVTNKTLLHFHNTEEYSPYSTCNS
jgi:hypothetical protein